MQTHHCIYFSPTLILPLYHALFQIVNKQTFIEPSLCVRHTLDIGGRLVSQENMAPFKHLKVKETFK